MAESEVDITLLSDSETLTISEDFIPSTAQRPSQTVTLSFDGLLTPPLLLQTNESQCGGQLWPGGMVLAEYLLQNRTAGLAGKTIVELGAGSGLVSLALALHLRSTNLSNTIYITDGLDVLIPLIQHNVSLNASNVLPPTLIHAAKLSWGEPLPTSIPQGPEIVLAADCCYIEESFPLLLRTLQDLIGEGTVCWFCFKKRRRADREMVRLLRREFRVVEVEGKWKREGVFVFEVRMR